jgi:hypothetical protein
MNTKSMSEIARFELIIHPVGVNPVFSLKKLTIAHLFYLDLGNYFPVFIFKDNA